MQKKELLDYVYVDYSRLYSYLNQLKEDNLFFKKLGVGIGINLGPVKLNTTELSKKSDTNVHEMISELIKLLDKSNSLKYKRPSSEEFKVDENVFVLEKHIEAKKVILPIKVKELQGLKNIVIWISMPSNVKPTKRSVLFLIETFWEDDRYCGMWSGCSALQWIVRNTIKSDPKFVRKYGYDLRTPIEKLKSLGAIEQGERTISCLYRKRYMTDEQMFEHDGDKFRCYDIIGYPVFISSP